ARVEAHLVGEPLRVQAPALAVSGDERPLPELRNGFELGRDRELQVMAGDSLVERGRLDVVATPAGRIGRVHEEDAAAAAVLGWREVVGDRAVRGRLDVAVGPWQDPEPVAHGSPGL